MVLNDVSTASVLCHFSCSESESNRFMRARENDYGGGTIITQQINWQDNANGGSGSSGIFCGTAITVVTSKIPSLRCRHTMPTIARLASALPTNT